MTKYSVKIRTIVPYLQARFSDEAQKSLQIKAGIKAKVDDSDSWKNLIYKDDKGIYIPQKQIRESLVNGGKSIKKKPYGSFKEAVQSYFVITPDKIYIGKQKPDSISESYPSRKDGLRVKLLHPSFDAGLEIEFELTVTNDDIDQKTVELIFEKAGYEKGIGAWRAGGHGRYELLELKVIK